MDISTKELYKALDTAYAIGDQLDNAGAGVKALSDGQYTTRSTIRVELVGFLLHIISRNENITQSQADVLSIVLEEDWPTEMVKQTAQDYKEMTPYDSTYSLLAFMMEDATYSMTEGKINTQRSDLLNHLFRMFGDLMLLAGDSRAFGSLLMEKCLLGMKQYAYNWISEHSHIQE